MTPLFITIYALWLASEIFWNRKLRSAKTDTKSKDKNSEVYIWIVIPISIFLGVNVAMNTNFTIFENQNWKLFGLFLIVFGMIFRYLAIKQLGKFFTVDVTIKQDHKIIQTGFYKYLRHPSYTSSLISFAGMGISLNNWYGFFIIFIPVFIVFGYRIAIEEKALIAQFGNDYLAYKKRVKALIPFVY